MQDPLSPLQPWPLLGKEQLGDYKIFTLNALRKQSPRTGKISTYYALETIDWVNTIAITPDQKLVMVEQYRHATGTIELELPGGMMNPDETDPVIAGCRELREETGYQGTDPKLLASYYANPAILTNQAHVVLVHNCTRQSELQWDEGEDIRIKLIPLAQIPDLVRTGQIRHSIVIASLYHLRLYQDQTGEK